MIVYFSIGIIVATYAYKLYSQMSIDREAWTIELATILVVVFIWPVFLVSAMVRGEHGH